MGFFDVPLSGSRLCRRDLVYPKWNGMRLVFRPAPVIEGSKILPAFLKEKNDISRFAYSAIGAIMFGIEGRQQSLLLAPSSDMSADEIRITVESSPYYVFMENIYANSGLVSQILNEKLSTAVDIGQILPKPTLLVYMNAILFESEGVVYYNDDLSDDRFKVIQFRASAAKDVQAKIKELIAASVDFTAPSCPKLWYIYGKKNVHTENAEESKFWRVYIEDALYTPKKRQKQNVNTTLSKEMLLKVRELLPPLTKNDFVFASENDQIRAICKAIPIPKVIEIGFKFNPQYLNIAKTILSDTLTSEEKPVSSDNKDQGSLLDTVDAFVQDTLDNDNKPSVKSKDSSLLESEASIFSGVNLGDEVTLDNFNLMESASSEVSDSGSDDEFSL